MQLRVLSPQHDMYSISHNTLCSTTVKCMTDTQLYCLKFMCLVYTYAVCTVILAPMEHRPWQFNTYARTYVHTYVGTYGGTLVAAVTLGLQVDRPREPCPLALLENVGTKACSSAPRWSDALGESLGRELPWVFRREDVQRCSGPYHITGTRQNW